MAQTQGAPQQSRQLPPPRGQQSGYQGRSNGNGEQRETDQEMAQRLFKEFRAQLNGKAFRDGVASIVPAEFRSVGYVDRLCESIFVACRDNPDLLLKCDRASLFRAAERIAKKGLTVGDNMAWLVPYNGQVQDQLGYMGAATLVMRSGVVKRFSCQPVYENDTCDIFLGTEPKVDHRPPMRDRRGAFIGVYAVAWMGDGAAPEIEWMPAEEVEFIRTSAPSKNSPAWKNWYAEMARGKCLKRLFKRMPKERPVDLDDMDDRNAQTIEGVVDRDLGLGQIAAPTEEPMAMDAGAGQPQREAEPARQQQASPESRREPPPADDGPLIDGYDDNLFGGEG